MAVPVAIYLAFNAGGAGAHGWGAAMSTDTAFALGVLALLPRGQATRLRVVLLTLAVVDDLVALLVIATVYTDHVDGRAAADRDRAVRAAVALRFVPFAWRAAGRGRCSASAIWVALFESGIDPMIAGLAVGLVTSAYPPAREDLERVTDADALVPRAADARARALGAARRRVGDLAQRAPPVPAAPVDELRDRAAVRAGQRRHPHRRRRCSTTRSPRRSRSASSSATWWASRSGILGASWLATRAWLAARRRSLSWPVIAGGGAVAGIGFTVSLLIASLAFDGQRSSPRPSSACWPRPSRAAGRAGRVFRRDPRGCPARCARASSRGTADEILDLAEDVDPERDHIRGADDAPVTLVEYGDYECPYCGQAEVVIRELLDRVRRRPALRLAPPPAQRRPPARADGGRGGRGGGRPGRSSGRCTTRCSRTRTSSSRATCATTREELGLDVDRFWDGAARPRARPARGEDVASADASGVAGTPTFFINGRRHQGAYDIETLTAAVERARRRARLEVTAAAR